MSRLLAVVLFLLTGASGAADPAPTKQPIGNWQALRGGNDHTKLTIEDGHLSWYITNGDDKKMTIAADYSVTKDNVLYAVITKVEGNFDKMPVEDDTFSFRFRIEDDDLQVRNLKGKPFDDPAIQMAAKGPYRIPEQIAVPKSPGKK